MKTRIAAIATLLIGALTSASPAYADTFPTRAIKVVVPFAPAGVQDAVTRIIFDRVGTTLGQAVVIENRPGAGGTLAMAAVAASPPDGYTLVVSDPRGSLAAAPSLYSKLSYDPRKSFEPIALIGSSGAVLSVAKDAPFATVRDLVDAAKQKPGELTFASNGNGTPGHLNGELFTRLAGIKVTHVPYRVVSQAITDLVTGRISFWISPLATVLSQIQAGQLRALMVAGEARLPDVPDIPTVKESGLGEFDVSTAYAFFAPANIPSAAAATLQEGIKEALERPEVQSRLRKAGVEPRLGSPDEVRAIVDAKVTQWAEVIKAAGIQIENR